VRAMKRLEHGSSMAWTAVFLITVLLPLMLLVVDGSRLLYIRGRLQTATDAACEAAAWVGGDRPTYIDTGQTHFIHEGDAIQVAQDTFAATLNERTHMAFIPELRLSLDSNSNQVVCAATAQVPILFQVAGIVPQVTVPASTITAIHFR
jgi:uncharacterized membrane protein